MARDLFPGMGQAVAERTVLRKGEGWGDVARRVAAGNCAIDGSDPSVLEKHIANASILMSGRHLQHGDLTQPNRNIEVFTNCLDGDTRILTMEYGPIAIRNVADQTITVIAGDGVPRPAKIRAHGEQQVFNITFRQNTSGAPGVLHTVTATADHRWKLLSGDITTCLKVGDVIAPAWQAAMDPAGVVHGLIFGDGTAHKRRHDHIRSGVSQGRTYASIRVCKSDAVRDEIHQLLDGAGYTYTQPPHADGDRVYYVGKLPHAKELPFSRDPHYIAGFIYGWWLADGHKGVNHALEISSSNSDAIEWLSEHASYAGYVVTMRRTMERHIDDGSFPNGKPLHVIRIRQQMPMKVVEISPAGMAPVYCPEEPVTSTFVLANGLLTGNCSTSAQRSLTFYLLLNGSGVGSSYDDAICIVDFRDMPEVICTIDPDHPDVISGRIKGYRSAAEVMLKARRPVHVFDVPDSRECWAEAVEKIETMAFSRRHKHETLIIDFTDVRPYGAPIGGMQGRPASGPGPLMDALTRVAEVKYKNWKPWRQALQIDHELAECVLVGGARRSARMATKYWRDPDILEFIRVKKDGGLWTANNSVAIDDAFWVEGVGVLEAILDAQYDDLTGEPGIINVQTLSRGEGRPTVEDALNLGGKYVLSDAGKALRVALVAAASKIPFPYITNPCGEIRLHLLGGYCTIADVVPFFTQDDDEAEEAFREATRALKRTNRLPALYQGEVARTDRIGVGFTGIHEYAWKRFGLSFKDLVAEGDRLIAPGLREPVERAKPFWNTLRRFAKVVREEAGDSVTSLTVKPAGTTSKLFGLTEGAHLPAMREYLRWVQFRSDDPLVQEYSAKGYPTRELKTYTGTTIVGFPTQPTICQLGCEVTTAAEATPEEQFRWLRLLETYWLGEERGNQISYTLKYDPKLVSKQDYKEIMRSNMPYVRAVSVMPQIDATAYEYQPESPISREEYEALFSAIDAVNEDIDLVHVDCAGGACPISFEKEPLNVAA
jgi:adenosylcobalamin-dependent ribonucleoside-triphosphate reductase